MDAFYWVTLYIHFYYCARFCMYADAKFEAQYQDVINILRLFLPFTFIIPNVFVVTYKIPQILEFHCFQQIDLLIF